MPVEPVEGRSMDPSDAICPSGLDMLRDFADLLLPSAWVTPTVDADLPRGDGHVVLFAPGILAGDYSTAPARRFFRRLGYDAQGWGLGPNLGPTRRIVQGLEARLFALNDRSGGRVSMIGRSLGGILLRELAKSHPDRVRRLILVCSPVRHPVPSLLAPVLHRFDRFYEPSYPREPALLNRPAPVPTTSFYTRIDGFLAWQHCLEEPSTIAENIELPEAGHCSAGLHKPALRLAASRLALPDRA
jgi:pimeloyl-ACP methyl ester carboxylesterase